MSEIIRVGGLEIRFLQTRHETGGSLDLFEMIVQPKARMPVPHYHESWDETVYGLGGTTAWRLDGTEMRLAAGETVFIRRGVVHGFQNVTNEPATCLVMLTPGALGPEYFQDMARLVARGTPDPTLMQETMRRYGLIPVPT